MPAGPLPAAVDAEDLEGARADGRAAAGLGFRSADYYHYYNHD